MTDGFAIFVLVPILMFINGWVWAAIWYEYYVLPKKERDAN